MRKFISSRVYFILLFLAAVSGHLKSISTSRIWSSMPCYAASALTSDSSVETPSYPIDIDPSLDIIGTDIPSDTIDADSPSDTIDIDALAEELHLLEDEYSYPDFKELYSLIRALRWHELGQMLLNWILETLTWEIRSTGLIYREVIGLILFTTIFSTLTSAFPGSSAGETGTMISWILLFMLLFSDFRIMSGLFRETLFHLSDVLKIMIPVFTAAVTVSGNLTAGVAVYEYFMLLILFLNWGFLHILLPGISYYFVLEMLHSLSPRQQLSRLCAVWHKVLKKGMRLTFYLFFGAHVMESMLLPSIDAARTGVAGQIAGLIPGAGSVARTVTNTVLASAMVIKNTLGVTIILFLVVILAIPLCKLLIYILFNVILSILLEPVSDRRYTACISMTARCGTLLIHGLGMSAALFIMAIAVTSMATNQMM
ncbi:MAG: stage III sporulation protein AE [Eubacterium sp.]|nr:stage III sporulation protein AE [Eubacterium sp.]